MAGPRRQGPSQLRLVLAAAALAVLVTFALLTGRESGATQPIGAAAGVLLLVVLALALARIRRDRVRLERLATLHERLAAGVETPPSAETAGDDVGRIEVALDRLAGQLGAGESGGSRHLALRDPLTGLPGRRLMRELLDKQLAQARRAGEQVGLLICDLDDLKAINESYGHAAGDRLLQTIAARLTGAIREADAVARSGEDEFALILGRVEEPVAVERVARRLMRGLSAPVEIGEREILFSTSIGVSLFPRDGEDGERLFDNAETALASAKSEGGNTVRIFDDQMSRRPRERAVLGQELRLALRDEQLTLYFQPQVAVAGGELVGLEALVRWPHPERGLVPAGIFIPVAEETGLMPDLGRWLIGAVCRQNAAWQRAGLTPLPVSVNVSGRQFQGGGDVAGMVEEALAASGLEARWLQLEITESIALDDFERISGALSRLRAQGVKIHLDDFGTGFSSLSYLLRLPVDVLKIDRSFVAGVPASRHGTSIVRAALSLAGSLGLEVVAEGVEEPAQLRFLEAEGCAVAQGYLLGRPAPVAEIEPLLAAGRIDIDALEQRHAARS